MPLLRRSRRAISPTGRPRQPLAPLATIAAQKAVDLQRRETREKNGPRPAVCAGEIDLAAGDTEADVVAQVVGREPSPEFAAQLDEEYRRQLDRLDDDGLRQIAVWKMEGYDNDEIARRLGCGVRTVEAASSA